MNYDVLVVGSGPAGLAAAVAARGRDKSVLVVGNPWQESPLARAEQVDNYLGLPGRTGHEMLEEFQRHAEQMGTEFLTGKAISLMAWKGFMVTVGSQVYDSRALILAPGVIRQAKYPGEEEYLGRGVSYCATCDGAFFKGKDVVLVGGGNTALEDALYLAKICGSVTLVHRRESFRGERRLAKAVQGHPNIRILYNATVTEIRGDETVNAVLIKDGKTGTVTPVGASAIFIAIGYEPENRMFSPPVRLDKAGYILAGEDCRTGVQGVFAAGDCRTKPLRQIVTATADGAVAAFQAGAYLSAEEEKKG